MRQSPIPLREILYEKLDTDNRLPLPVGILKLSRVLGGVFERPLLHFRRLGRNRNGAYAGPRWHSHRVFRQQIPKLA